MIRGRRVGGNQPRQVHVAVSLAEQAKHGQDRLAEQRRQLLRRAERVLDQEVIGDHVVGRLRDRQLDAVAVGDQPAGGRNRVLSDLLADRRLLQRAGPQYPQVDGPRHGEGEEDQEADEDPADPTVEDGHRARPTRRALRRRRRSACSTASSLRRYGSRWCCPGRARAGGAWVVAAGVVVVVPAAAAVVGVVAPVAAAVVPAAPCCRGGAGGWALALAPVPLAPVVGSCRWWCPRPERWQSSRTRSWMRPGGRAGGRERSDEGCRVGLVDPVQRRLDVTPLPVQELDRGWPRHHHAHAGSQALYALIVAEDGHIGAQLLVAAGQGGPALERAARAGAELERLDLHGHDPSQEHPEDRDPGPSADDPVQQRVIGQGANERRRPDPQGGPARNRPGRGHAERAEGRCAPGLKGAGSAWAQ